MTPGERRLGNLPFFLGSVRYFVQKPGPSPYGGIFDGPCLSRIAEVRVLRLWFGVGCLKSQIPSTKFQINLKFQIPNRF